jgi:hypothetical protein
VIEASCHCGAVRLEITGAPDSVTDCNCSICRRRGALWAYYRPDQVKLIHAPGATVAYLWGDRMIAFRHCKICGCTTHWESIGEPRVDRMGVNARLMEPEILASLPIRRVDGASR